MRVVASLLQARNLLETGAWKERKSWKVRKIRDGFRRRLHGRPKRFWPEHRPGAALAS